MTDEFDDDALRDALVARSGGPVEPIAGRKAVVARAGRIRTRRSVAVGGAATAVVVAGLALIPLRGDDAETPSDVVLPAATVDTDNTAIPSSTTESERPLTTVQAETTTTDDLNDNAVVDGETADGAEPVLTVPSDGVGSTIPISPGSTPSTGVPESTAPATTASAPPTPTAPTTSPTTTPPAPTTIPTTTDAPRDVPFTEQYSSAGGSITVRWNGSALSLQAVDPVAGFDAEIEDQSASRLRVRFRSDDDDTRIDVRANDGKVSVDIS